MGTAGVHSDRVNGDPTPFQEFEIFANPDGVHSDGVNGDPTPFQEFEISANPDGVQSYRVNDEPTPFQEFETLADPDGARSNRVSSDPTPFQEFMTLANPDDICKTTVSTFTSIKETCLDIDHHKKRYRRKLFENAEGNENTFMTKKFKFSSKPNTEDIVTTLLGDSAETQEFKKYRRLMKNDKSFQKAYDRSLAKVQIQISKKHRELKDNALDENGMHGH